MKKIINKIHFWFFRKYLKGHLRVLEINNFVTDLEQMRMAKSFSEEPASKNFVMERKIEAMKNELFMEVKKQGGILFETQRDPVMNHTRIKATLKYFI